MPEIKQYSVTEPYLKLDCGLGEAPFWEKSSDTLRFVDIVKSRLHTVDLKIGPSSHKVLAELDISIGCTGDIEGEDDRFVFGGKHGIGIFDKTTAKYTYVKRMWSEEEKANGKEHRLRSNDGAVDCKGRFWVGTMCDPLVTEPKPEGVLFRLDPDMTLHRMIENVTIPNGISWSKDNQTMYFTDSPTSSVHAYDFDAESGNISNKRVFYHVDEDGAVPDGHALDADGFMWISLFGGGKVIRVTPHGKKVAEVLLPTRCISCPAFVGEDLVITSAAEEEPEKHPDSTRLAGSVFKIHVGIQGQPLHKFKLNQV